MKVLFCGDIVGRSGREAVIRNVPKLREQLGLDFVVVNGENAAAGFGITAKICAELHNAGVDCITTGNHVWDQRDIVGYIAQDKRLLRPLNFPPGTPGWGANLFETRRGQKIVVTTNRMPANSRVKSPESQLLEGQDVRTPDIFDIGRNYQAIGKRYQEIFTGAR